jgi:hypothetical protein
MPERYDPTIFANTLVEHVADQEVEHETASYLVGVFAEVMELVPAIKEHFSDTLLMELKEEIARREDARYARATVGLIEEIEQDWRNGR